MLISISTLNRTTRSLRREQGLRYDGLLRTPSIGCSRCNDVVTCGGLRIKQAVFDCLQFCCKRPESCDTVCRNSPLRFAERVREVGGFELETVPPLRLVSAPPLPEIMPVIYHRIGRKEPFSGSPVVALPLYKVIGRHCGERRYRDRKELADGFGIREDTAIILTGSGRDAPLERWWSLGTQRKVAIRALKELGVSLVTTPNFSLFNDQPRWDDMHSMKRIALTHEEFLGEDVAAALHVNARTDRDWARWAVYIAARPAITHLAFEFATGAGSSARAFWYANHLVQLAKTVGHSLHLIVRGGTRVLPLLKAAFSGVTLIETNSFMKTMYRQQLEAMPLKEGNSQEQTTNLEILDDLLSHNWAATLRLAEESEKSGKAAE